MSRKRDIRYFLAVLILFVGGFAFFLNKKAGAAMPVHEIGRSEMWHRASHDIVRSQIGQFPEGIPGSDRFPAHDTTLSYRWIDDGHNVTLSQTWVAENHEYKRSKSWTHGYYTSKAWASSNNAYTRDYLRRLESGEIQASTVPAPIVSQGEASQEKTCRIKFSRKEGGKDKLLFNNKQVSKSVCVRLFEILVEDAQ